MTRQPTSRVQLTLGFDDETAASQWVTTALCRHLLPEITGLYDVGDGQLIVADVRRAPGRPVPLARPTTGALLATHNQRLAAAWLILCLLQEDDSRLALHETGIDPDSVHLDGSDLTYQTTTGPAYRIQFLPIDQPPT